MTRAIRHIGIALSASALLASCTLLCAAVYFEVPSP
jgi:hypothetical protein